MFFLRRRTAEMPRRTERIMKGRKDAEKSHAINEQMNDLPEMKVRVCRGKDNGENQYDLKGSRELAENAGRKRPIPRDEQYHHGHDKNQDVAAEDDNREPPRDLFLECQNNERRREQQLIRDGIEISTERRPLIQTPSEQTINAVR